MDSVAVKTLRANARSLLGIDPNQILQEDARHVDFTPFAGVDLLAGGPPCQPFSTGGKGLGPDDPRNMFPAMFRAAGQILPRAILIENVKGLTRPKFEKYYRYILKQLEFPRHMPSTGVSWTEHLPFLDSIVPAEVPQNEQYEVAVQVIDAADFGVPQRRQRIIITAFRRDTGIKPAQLAPTHGSAPLHRTQFLTGEYWLKHGQQKPGTEVKPSPTHDSSNGIAPWVTVRDAFHGLPPAVPRGVQAVELENHIQHPGARAYPGHSGSGYDQPAKALKAGAHGTPGGENTLRPHPDSDEVRYFTIREAARLQTFPDEWTFQGSWGACIRQLGNAVPVRVGEQFAKEIRRNLNHCDKEDHD
jgi:DNA (cytosine-5)-methyltransferase 1